MSSSFWSCWLTVIYNSGPLLKYVNRFWKVFPDIGNPIDSGPGMIFYITDFLCWIMDPMCGTILFDKIDSYLFPVDWETFTKEIKVKVLFGIGLKSGLK